MAGILANSVSVTMTTATADNTNSGFVTGEQITLSVTPAASSSLSWGIAIPSASSAARTALDDNTSATPVFTPDVGGYYVITCTVDSTTSYVLRLSVATAATATAADATNYTPIADASVPTPTLGATLFCSSATSGIAVKDSGGHVLPVLPGVVGANLTDANEVLVIGDGVHRAIPSLPLTANRTKTLGGAGAEAGHSIWIHRFDSSAYTVTVVDGPGSTTLFTFPASELHSARFSSNGSNWSLAERVKLA